MSGAPGRRSQTTVTKTRRGATRRKGEGIAAPPPSGPTPIDTYFTPDEQDGLPVWSPNPYAKQLAFMATLHLERRAHFQRR